MDTFLAVLLALIAWDGIKMLCSYSFWHGVKGGYRGARAEKVFHDNISKAPRSVPMSRTAAEAIVASAMKGMHS